MFCSTVQDWPDASELRLLLKFAFCTWDRRLIEAYILVKGGYLVNSGRFSFLFLFFVKAAPKPSLFVNH